MSKDSRKQIGQVGEQIAAEHLERRGVRILQRNYRTRNGEIDLIAKDQTSIVFCEVKARCQHTPGYDLTPLIAITSAKQLQVRRMARQWLSERKPQRLYTVDIRFDAIGITLDKEGALIALEHLEGAF